MDLKELEILGEDISEHWYYRAKAAAMTRLIGPAKPWVILDVGAGSGFFARHLLRHGMASEAWCVDIGYARDHDLEEGGKPVHYRRSVERVAADLVLLIDVLEHVDDDLALLRDYVRRAPSGTRFLIAVPAFAWVWSGHDEFLGHKRRYRLDELETLARGAGLQTRRGAYYFGLLFPIAAATRLAERWFRGRGSSPKSQLRRHGSSVNRLLTLICKAELPLLAVNRLAGLTAFCLAERP